MRDQAATENSTLAAQASDQRDDIGAGRNGQKEGPFAPFCG